jgi:hypothetical protein
MTFPFHLARDQSLSQKFESIGTGIWHTWQKPSGASLIEIIVCGAGGAGGNGFGAAAGAEVPAG